MREGKVNSDVLCLERRLIELGYRQGPADRVFDVRTTVAVRQFQRAEGILVTGVAGPGTSARLGIWGGLSLARCPVAAIQRPGAPSGGTLCLERRLAVLGYLITSIDRTYDDDTSRAVAAYQRSHRLFVTGVAGGGTLAKLGIWGGPSLAACDASSTQRPGMVKLGTLCLERRLVARGSLLRPLDRTYDASTASAVRNYQRRVGLVVTGVAGPATLARLDIWNGPSVRTTCKVSRPVVEGTRAAVARCLEQRLIQFGYDIAPADEHFGERDVAALRAYQRRAGITADGMAGAWTLTALGIWQPPPPVTCKVDTIVRWGTEGYPARCVELKLVSLGYALEGPDGYFGTTSTNAVRIYQSSKGLDVDGIAGAQTLIAMGIWSGPRPEALPANSGSGRRIVYHRGAQRIWAVDASGVVVKTHRVSGRLYEPYAGTYSVYSRSLHTYSAADPSVRWMYMVRFAYGPNGGRIGFHEIPNRNGVPLQTKEQLGLPLSGGCVRQATEDALWVWNWAPIGTKVVVL